MEQGMPPAASKRLLNTTTYQLVFDNHKDVRQDPRYAIVSHRWLEDEITFHTFERQTLLDSSLDAPELNKIRGACQKAREQGIKWLWLDSVCINKISTMEDSTAIRSMFSWYRNATICYTYLADVIAPSPIVTSSQLFRRADKPEHFSEWFTRAWCLQESLASERMQFYDRNWTHMGDSTELAEPIAAITRIHIRYSMGMLTFAKQA